jgi:hypothetical protein
MDGRHWTGAARVAAALLLTLGTMHAVVEAGPRGAHPALAPS